MSARPLPVGAVLLAATLAAAAAQDLENVRIVTREVAGGVYMLEGAGGNIGLCVGNDGAFMIDDQFAPLTETILAAVAQVTDRPVRFLVNTHWHADHTGGNENLGRAGAIIVAHENVRKRLSTDQFMREFDRAFPARPAEALPVITFAESLTFHWNGDEIDVFHARNAHTDGDAVIHFKRSGVLHMGDTFFNGSYPFIDVEHGGSIDGMIAAVDRVLPLCTAKTRIIPGHGPLAGEAELREYRSVLETVRDRVAALLAEGRSREEAIAARPGGGFDESWGGGFVTPDRFVRLVYDSLAAARGPG